MGPQALGADETLGGGQPGPLPELGPVGIGDLGPSSHAFPL